MQANSLETHPSLGGGWVDKGGLPPGLSLMACLNPYTQSMVMHVDINSCEHTHTHRCIYSHKSSAQTETALSDNNHRLGQTGEGGGRCKLPRKELKGK